MNLRCRNGISTCLSSYCEIVAGDVVILAAAAGIDPSLVGRIETDIHSITGRSVDRLELLEWSAAATCLRDGGVLVFLEEDSSSYKSEVRALFEETEISVPRVYRIFGANEELFIHGFGNTKDDTRRLNSALIDYLRFQPEVRITSAVGTDLEITLDRRYGWIDSHGRPDRSPGILPPSEVATYSHNVSGILIADGALNSNFGLPGSALLSGRNVKLEIEGGVLVGFHTDSPLVNIFLSQFFSHDAARRVGELGFGTNLGLSGFSEKNCHLNERFPSFHIGFGAHNQGAILAWSYPLHLDFICSNVTMSAGAEVFHSGGCYNVPSSKGHSNTPQIGYADTF